MFDLMPFDRRRNGSVTRYDPFKELDDFRRSFWDMEPWNSGSTIRQFSTDIRDDGDKYVVMADMPGFNKEDINVDVSGSNLTITASRQNKTENKDSNFIRCERSYGSYSRSFDISEVNADNITAQYKDGVLTLDLPKKTGDTAGVRRLTIE